MEAKLIEHADLPPRVKKLRKRIRKSFEGYLLGDIAMALLDQYSEILLMGSPDFETHQRNVKVFVTVLDANARHHFKVNN